MVAGSVSWSHGPARASASSRQRMYFAIFFRLPSRGDGKPGEIVPESVVVHVDGTEKIEDGPRGAGVSVENGPRRLVIDGFQGVRIERAHRRVTKGDHAHQLEDPDEVVRRVDPEAFPSGKEQRRHLACAEQDEFANIGPGVRQVGPVVMTGVREGGEQLGAGVQCIEEPEDLFRRPDLLTQPV